MASVDVGEGGETSRWLTAGELLMDVRGKVIIQSIMSEPRTGSGGGGASEKKKKKTHKETSRVDTRM